MHFCNKNTAILQHVLNALFHCFILSYVKASLICLTKIKERTMTQKKGIAKVSCKMKKMKEKAAKVLIAIAKKGLKNDLESTGYICVCIPAKN